MAELAQNYVAEKLWWITNRRPSITDIADLVSWIVVDEKKSSIANEKLFCDGKILEKLLQTHQKLDRLSDFQLNSSRKRANVFEDIGKSIFIDRSAVKLANIDYLLDGIFSKPIEESFNINTRFSLELRTSTKSTAETIVFIGGNPGGFVDYILWRKGWKARCFGFGCKDSYRTDWFISDPLSFQVYDGPNKDGDITNPNNLTFFIDFIKRKSPDGIPLVFADVALPIYRARESKEIISKRLHLACCAYALAVLKPGGHFILKIFDTFTPFTVGLLYIMYDCFKTNCIVKPHSSRPSNSERYLICLDKLPGSNVDKIMNHLLEVNESMVTEEAEISELVALDVLKRDSTFFSQIFDSNNAIMTKQIEATEKLLRFANDATLQEDELKVATKERFLKLWNLPISITKEDETRLPAEYAKGLYHRIESLLDYNTELEEICGNSLRLLSYASYCLPIENVNDNDRTYFLGKGKDEVYKFDKINRIWTLITDIIVKLPAQTLVYGEIITIYDAKNTHEGTTYLHIIDGYVLGGVNIYSLEYIRRSSMCHEFVLSIGNQRKYLNGKKIVAVQSLMKIKGRDAASFLQKLKTKIIHKKKHFLVNVGRNRYFVTKGLLIFHQDQDLPHKVYEWNEYFISRMASGDL